jgi:hypothetical protein
LHSHKKNNKKTCPKHNNLSSFQNLFIHAVYHLPPKPIKQMVHGIVNNVSCTNKFCIAMHLIMGQPQWSKWKIKTNCAMFFFLSKIPLAPWVTCCSIISKSMLHLDLFWKHVGCHKALVAIQKVKVRNPTYRKPMPLLLMRSFYIILNNIKHCKCNAANSSSEVVWVRENGREGFGFSILTNLWWRRFLAIKWLHTNNPQEFGDTITFSNPFSLYIPFVGPNLCPKKEENASQVFTLCNTLFKCTRKIQGHLYIFCKAHVGNLKPAITWREFYAM